MPRPHRSDCADVTYHVLNRANARLQIFANQKDYDQFEEVLFEAQERTGIRLYAYAVMPNHWHMIVAPQKDGDLTKFVGWLTLTHTKRWHTTHESTGSGHLYQGRYKSFPIQSDSYFLTACRYVEQNPLRAHLVSRAQDWMWGSLWRREFGTLAQKSLLNPWEVAIPRDYLRWVNEWEGGDQISAIRTCVKRGQPFGSSSWVEKMTKEFGLSSTLRSVGRPKNDS